MNLIRFARSLGFSALLGATASAWASPFILSNYTRVGATEALVAPFTSPSTATTNSYSGLVEVLVSGTGFSLFGNLNDAFYGVPSGAPYDAQYYQLNLGWTTAPLVPLSGEPRNINNFIVFIEGVGAVTSPSTPAYDANHTYHFVVDTGLLAAQNLQFGVSDGNFGDNGGAYNVAIWQLEAGAQGVPDSAGPAVWLALLALLAVKEAPRMWSRR